MHVVPPLPAVFTIDDAVQRGFTRAQVRGRVDRGLWLRLRRGTFCVAQDWAEADPARRHVLLAAAYAVTNRQSSAFAMSHATAAAVLGVPVAHGALARLHVTVAPATGLSTRRDEAMHLHVAGLSPADVVRVEGVPVTTAARTLADCLRHLPTDEAVAVADAALRSGSTTRPDVEAVLARQARWPFAAVAAASLALVDPRRESGLESRSAVVMHRYHIPVPEPQVRILDAGGRFVARVDFAWLSHGVVGEADGRVKYGDDAARVVEAEKDRQARLEALGLVVVRWDARHLYGVPPELVVRLRRALAAGHAARFRGRAA